MGSQSAPTQVGCDGPAVEDSEAMRDLGDHQRTVPLPTVKLPNAKLATGEA